MQLLFILWLYYYYKSLCRHGSQLTCVVVVMFLYSSDGLRGDRNKQGLLCDGCCTTPSCTSLLPVLYNCIFGCTYQTHAIVLLVRDARLIMNLKTSSFCEGIGGFIVDQIWLTHKLPKMTHRQHRGWKMRPGGHLYLKQKEHCLKQPTRVQCHCRP